MIGRLKFDLSDLANEMLDQLPVDLFVSETTTFLDPCMSGGQFVKAIEQRLRSYGHNDKNIAKRVFGIESSRLRINYAINKHGLVGQYRYCEDYLGYDEKMKFDVVIGNPPYQSGNGEKGGARSLWRKFVRMSFSVVSENGFVSLVCPGFPYESHDLGYYFKNNTPIFLNNDVSNYFKGIGSEVKAWIVQQGVHNKDFMVDGNIWDTQTNPCIPPLLSSILQKTIGSNELFECKQDRGYSSTQFKNDSSDYFEEPTEHSIYPIRHAAKTKICYVKQPTKCHYKRKVMMTLSGYPAFEYYDENYPISSCYQMSGYIEVENRITGESLIKLYNSKLYRLLSQGIFNAGMKSVKNYNLPKVDLTHAWTDEELYEHFGLTKEEIDYIETAVK